VNRTFLVNQYGGYDGLVTGKKMLAITTRGGSYAPGTPTAQYDFQAPYLRAIFAMIGITDIVFIHVEGLGMGDEMRAQALSQARAAMNQLVTHW
jgi:FMN-dependent NADH-azoreductase